MQNTPATRMHIAQRYLDAWPEAGLHGCGCDFSCDEACDGRVSNRCDESCDHGCDVRFGHTSAVTRTIAKIATAGRRFRRLLVCLAAPRLSSPQPLRTLPLCLLARSKENCDN